MAQHAQYFIDDKSRRIYQTKQVIKNIFVYLFLSLFGLFLVAPFILMIWGSFVKESSFQDFTTLGHFEALFDFGVENFDRVFHTTLGTGGGTFAVFFLNTLIVAVCSTTVTVVTAVLAGFAFARLEFKGKEALFAVLLATMMIPGEMMVITNYATVIKINWTNTFAALILVHGVSVFYVFYLRQTFQQIPNELYLAAKVDGVSDIGYLWKVMIPIAMPTITTIIILSMMGSWNSYVWPDLVAKGTWRFGKEYLGIDHSMMLVSAGLRALFEREGTSQGDALKLAGSMVISMPLFIVFICFRKYIMKGVSRSGIKG